MAYLIGLLAFGVPFILSALLTGAACWLAPRLGFVDKPGGHKTHDRAMPLGGGVALFLAWTLPVGLLLVLACRAAGGDSVEPWLAKHLAELSVRAAPLGLMLLGGLLIMVLGLVDDAVGLSVRLRVVVQLAVAAALYAASRELRITLFAGFWGMAWLSAIATVVWVFAITNAFNFLDNMDGLSSGVALVASVLLAVVGFQTGQVAMAWLALALAGTTAGFLLFNFPPARIFMGDAGGLFLGFVMSLLTILFTYYRTGTVTPWGTYYGLLMPLFILALPIFDTLSVVVIRLRERRPIWKGDTSHFSHRLVALGMSKREAVLFIYLVAFCLGLASTLLNDLKPRGAVTIFVIGVAIFTLIVLLERAGRRRH